MTLLCVCPTGQTNKRGDPNKWNEEYANTGRIAPHLAVGTVSALPRTKTRR